MVIRFSSKTNTNGWNYQLVYDDEKKIYDYGNFIFTLGDVVNLTKKQLDRIERVLISNGYRKIKSDDGEELF